MTVATRRLVGAAALLLAAPISMAGRATPQAADVAALLAQARQALGGDAALSAVTAFTVKGSRTTTFGGSGSIGESIELVCALPDRFLERSAHTSNLGPLGMAGSSSRRGFNGADPIDEVESNDPLPEPIVAGRGGPPVDPADARARRLRAGKRTFVERVFPLFASSFDSAPLTITAVGQGSGPTGPAYAINLTTADGLVLTAFVDAKTHVVAGLMWNDKPIVFGTFSTSTTVREKVGSPGSSTMSIGPPPVLPAPPANLPDVTWQMTVTDYRPEGPLNWPHRFTTSFGGQKYEELKLSEFKINPTIDPSVFRVSR
jgi:hypothetical protein